MVYSLASTRECTTVSSSGHSFGFQTNVPVFREEKSPFPVSIFHRLYTQAGRETTFAQWTFFFYPPIVFFALPFSKAVKLLELEQTCYFINAKQRHNSITETVSTTVRVSMRPQGFPQQQKTTTTRVAVSKPCGRPPSNYLRSIQVV